MNLANPLESAGDQLQRTRWFSESRGWTRRPLQVTFDQREAMLAVNKPARPTPSTSKSIVSRRPIVVLGGIQAR